MFETKQLATDVDVHVLKYTRDWGSSMPPILGGGRLRHNVTQTDCTRKYCMPSTADKQKKKNMKKQDKDRKVCIKWKKKRRKESGRY